ncbi:MAG: S-layer protein [Candidatus Woesearchaeota archaeon]
MKLRNTVKKIAALTTGTAMIGATMMGAMAAVDLQQYPEPFIKDGVWNGMFVVGETAMPADVISGMDIAMSLQAAAVVETVVPLPGEYQQTVVAGGAKFASGSQDLHFGRTLSDAKSTFTDADLGVLARSQLTTTDGVNFDVEFRVSAPASELKYGRDIHNLDDPTFYVDFNQGETWDMTILFPRALDLNRTRGESIELFGKEFVVAEAAAETNQATQKLTLYMATVDRTFEAGTTNTVTVGDKQYTITVIGVNTDQNSATVTINGETRQVSSGSTYTFGGERFYVKDVMGYTVPVGGGAVRLFIGSEKLVLEHNQPVTKGQNDDVVDGTNVAFSGTTETSSITVTITPRNQEERIEGLELGQEYVDPVFGALQMSFADAVPGLRDTNSRDHVRVYPSGNDRLSLQFQNYVGQEYNMEILRGDANGVGVNPRYGGGTHQVYVLTNSTPGNTSLVRDNRFILRQDTQSEYTRVLELVSVTDTGNQRIRLRDVSSGGTTQEFSADSNGVGTISYDGDQYTFYITGPINVSLEHPVSNVLVTRRGAELVLPGVVINTTDGAANLVLIEETAFNDGEPRSHGNVTLDIVYDTSFSGSRKMRVVDVDYDHVSGTVNSSSDLVSSDTNTDRLSMVTPYGTYVWYDSSDSVSAVDLYYPRSQMFFNVFLAPAGAEVSEGGAEGDIISERVNRIAVGSAVLDSQAVNMIGQENLIVIGGPCVNQVAMRLMGTPEACTEGFEPGKAWIKYFEHAGDKVSLMVAGYEARDTTLAGQVLANYDRYRAQLQGKEVVVSGGSLSQVQITAPTQ